jgi:Trypsin-like peptidase domain
MATAWFEDLPLDWTRSDLREAAAAIETGYPTTGEVTFLAKESGLAIASLNLTGPTRAVVREVLEKARMSGRLEQLLFEVFASPTIEAIHEVLRKTLAGYEAKLQAAALDRRPSLDLLARLPADVVVRGDTGQETLLNAMAPFDDPALFRSRLAASEVRVCQVVVRNEPAGSGFLVGNDHILTNWHVVRSLGDQGGDDGVAVFDHKRDTGGAVVSPGRAVAFAQDWKVASSAFATDDVEKSPSGPDPGLYDYALVHLSEPVGAQGIGGDAKGDQRGGFALGARTTPISADEPLWVLGHPSKLPLQLSYASPAGATLSTNQTRLRYKINTENGSSGSVVLDHKFDAVALHHFGGTSTNQGVPVGLIVEDLRAQLSGSAVLADLGL